MVSIQVCYIWKKISFKIGVNINSRNTWANLNIIWCRDVEVSFTQVHFYECHSTHWAVRKCLPYFLSGVFAPWSFTSAIVNPRMLQQRLSKYCFFFTAGASDPGSSVSQHHVEVLMKVSYSLQSIVCFYKVKFKFTMVVTVEQ